MARLDLSNASRAIIALPCLLGGFGLSEALSRLWWRVDPYASSRPAAGGEEWRALLTDVGSLLGQLVSSPPLTIAVLALVGSMAWVWLHRPHNATSPGRNAERRHSVPRSVLDDTSAQLSAEIGGILGLVRTHLEANSRYAEALTKAQAALGPLAEPSQVWAIVKLLMQENEKIRSDAASLRASLEQSEASIKQLRADLAVAEEAASQDSLTLVGNRRHFDDALAKAIAQSHADKTALCLVLADLDDFKKINDKLGHLVGDEILRLFAGLLTRNVKGRDKVARYGGEEFAIILPHTTMGNAYHLTEHMRRELEGADWLLERTGESMGKLTASFGIAQLKDGDGPEELLSRADAKLYEAKRGGRNRIAIEHSVAA